jgi:hypothetical protein
MMAGLFFCQVQVGWATFRLKGNGPFCVSQEGR